jgi:hypothetical protein
VPPAAVLLYISARLSVAASALALLPTCISVIQSRSNSTPFLIYNTGALIRAVPVPSTNVEPFYRTRVTIVHLGLHDVPFGFRVTPGMPVIAHIKVGKRTVLKYLLGWLMPVAQEGMREP